MEDIFDIKDIVRSEYPPFWLKVTAIVFIAFVFLGFLFFIVRKLKTKKKFNPASEIPIKLLSPIEEALEALRNLDQKKWIEAAKFRSYFLELSEILRRFLERTFDFPAVEKTTEEISNLFRKQNLLSFELSLKLVELLSKMDLVKFAKATTALNEASSLRNTTEHLMIEIAHPKRDSLQPNN